MNTRKFGKIGWDVSEISLGCWAMGADWGDVSEEQAKDILKTSFDNGVNFFDTADVYGDGRSEKFVGEFINSTSERIYVATKAGRRLNPHNADGYNLKNIESFIDRSLSNLGVDVIDLVQLHCPPSEICGKLGTYEMMDEIVKKGKKAFYIVQLIISPPSPLFHTPLMKIIENNWHTPPLPLFIKNGKSGPKGV